MNIFTVFFLSFYVRVRTICFALFAHSLLFNTSVNLFKFNFLALVNSLSFPRDAPAHSFSVSIVIVSKNYLFIASREPFSTG